ncbi:hypothetical protein AMAG_15071 [Allomyces macrogynus ATCC 38327]|uniref:DUF7886 domain-containing protein n=1 Tax=Allomyces macrogynus (strain ATCC 38327) TaxID=578462 RepID=A0A0L0T5R8_ALLM3|nr:hypothetical protein AMAG_15071 [Allomyces macrogynus ATCC 38327]|eukprot:KNE70092.1 hypothetical protein AMAG_15071 [Allomyces macrogynus ATCC 38327]
MMYAPPPPPPMMGAPPPANFYGQNAVPVTAPVPVPIPPPQAAAQQAPPPAAAPVPAAKPKSEASKLNAFLAECLAVGCLKGFKYYELYLRGREELLLRVYNNPDDFKKVSKQPSSMNLARSQSRIMLSNKTQNRLMWQSTDALPPASPCDRELEKDPSKTAFLIAGYARYKCPFVWLRTNHSKFAKLTENSKHDDPIKLESAAAWKTSDNVRVSDIIAEVIGIAVSPPPINPFAVNLGYYDDLPLEESVVCVGAMLDFLQKIYLSNSPYALAVFRDIEKLSTRLWQETAELSTMVATGAASPRRTTATA